jgi:hypothetical protein
LSGLTSSSLFMTSPLKEIDSPLIRKHFEKAKPVIFREEAAQPSR